MIMKGVLKIGILVFSLALISASCEKEPPVDFPVIETPCYQKISFIVVLKDTAEIDAVATEWSIYLPRKDKSEIHTSTYIRTFNNFSDTLRKFHYSGDDSIYPGVFYQLGVNVRFKDNHGDKYGNNFWKLPVDTVRSAADTLVIFHYPEDTVKCIRYDWTTGVPN